MFIFCFVNKQMAAALWKMFLGFILIFISLVQCERVKDRMYVSLEGAFCFKRLTATGQHGCSTSLSGDTGVIHFVDSSNDIDWIVKSGEAGPYVPVMELNDFLGSNMKKLKNSGKVSGVLLWHNSTISSFSAEDTCPNRNAGLPSEACDNTEAWNPVGSGMMFVDWGFPIAFLQNLTTVDLLRQCYNEHNSELTGQMERPLCSVQVQAHMLAAVDSPTCIRRSQNMITFTPVKYCDALGDYSVYLTAPAKESKEPYANRSVILLIARMDGLSMFDSLTPGALSPVTNIVTLLTVSKYLREMGALTIPSDKTLVLALVNGESFDYIGSSRIVYDMEKGLFPSEENPIRLSNIGLIVEIDQISGGQVFYHTHSSDPILTNFTEVLQMGLKNHNLNLTKSTGKLPPSSIQRFLLADPDIPSLVISNYNSSYKNQFYNSMLDTSTSLGYVFANGSDPISEIQKQIDGVADSVARAFYFLMHQPYIQPTLSKVLLVDELLHCYLETMNCSLFYYITNQTYLLDTPAPTYVGVFNNNNTITRLTGLAMANFTGTDVRKNMSACANASTPGLQYIWMTETCVETSVSYYMAWSPAFEINGYNWTSQKYSSWTESVWRELNIRMYLTPSYKHEILNIATGLVILIISFASVHFINSKSDVLLSRVVLRSADRGW